jgi:hypothetical protein
MQSLPKYLTNLTLPNGVIKYTEVPVPNTSYSKIVLEDGTVAILVHDNYGSGWSTGYYSDNARQLIFDSRIILYVLSNEFKEYFTSQKRTTDKALQIYENLMRPIFPKMDYPTADTFSKLSVKFIPERALFRINEYDGVESVELFDINNYMYA